MGNLFTIPLPACNISEHSDDSGMDTPTPSPQQTRDEDPSTPDGGLNLASPTSTLQSSQSTATPATPESSSTTLSTPSRSSRTRATMRHRVYGVVKGAMRGNKEYGMRFVDYLEIRVPDSFSSCNSA